MTSVSIHGPKAPVTKASNCVAVATVPNVCKMPGPPAPFVPTPLPNIGRGNMRQEGYSTSVKIEGKEIAITGASFGSMGDIASKGTGGGIVSNNAEGPTKFISPGSFTVKVEGKNVQLFTDLMSNNNGPSGSPPNAATMMGNVNDPGKPGRPAKAELKCGEFGTYGDQKKKTGKGKYHRDHVPSYAALLAKARELASGRGLSTAQMDAIKGLALSIVVPASAHQGVSRTYGGRNTPTQIQTDSKDLQGAAKKDLDKMKKDLGKHADADCVKAYEDAAEKVEKRTNKDYEDMISKILAPPG